MRSREDGVSHDARAGCRERAYARVREDGRVYRDRAGVNARRL
jgi:hypothetical protein